MCYERLSSLPLLVTDSDLSGDAYICRKLSDVTDAARLAYYGVKLLKALGELGPLVP